MGHISMVGKTDANVLRAGAPRIAPGLTLEIMAEHTLSFWLTSEDLPDPRQPGDPRGDGRIVLDYRPNNEEAHKRLIGQLRGLLKEIRCHRGRDLPLERLHPGAHSARRRRPSERHHPLRATTRRRRRST